MGLLRPISTTSGTALAAPASAGVVDHRSCACSHLAVEQAEADGFGDVRHGQRVAVIEVREGA